MKSQNSFMGQRSKASNTVGGTSADSFWQIFVEALEEFPILIIQSRNSVSMFTSTLTKNFHASTALQLCKIMGSVPDSSPVVSLVSFVGSRKTRGMLPSAALNINRRQERRLGTSQGSVPSWKRRATNVLIMVKIPYFAHSSTFCQ